MPIEKLRGVYCVLCDMWLLPKVGAGDGQWVEVELVAPAVSTSRTSSEKTEMQSRSSESRSKCWQWKGETRSGPDRRARAACARFASAFVVPQINQWMTLIRQPVNWLQFLGCDVSTLVSISDKLLQAWHPPLMKPLRQHTKNSQWEIHLWERSCTTSCISVSFKMAALHSSRRNRGDASFRRAVRSSRFSVNVTRELSLSCLFDETRFLVELQNKTKHRKSIRAACYWAAPSARVCRRSKDTNMN